MVSVKSKEPGGLTMGEHIICGIDAHDERLDCRIGVDREASERRRFENSWEGRRELLEHLELLSDKHGGAKVMVGYEACPGSGRFPR
jgi:hypothetical protein